MVSKIFTLIVACALDQAQAVYDSSAIVPMAKYSKTYRTLSMQQCFVAQGKMCILKDGGSMIQYTGSSNRAHGVCCRPTSVYDGCVAGDRIVCSQPVTAAQTKKPYDGILTDAKMNYQMYAFAATTTNSMCIKLDPLDMKNLNLKPVYKKPTTINLSGATALQYHQATKPSERHYDSCYYQLNAATIPGDKGKNLRIFFKLTKSTNMNVYIYGGKSRESATQYVINDNNQAEIGKEYTVPVTEGMLIVAYPNEDQVTDFEFKYWTDNYTKTVVDLAIAFDHNGPLGEQARIISYVGIGVISLLVLCCIGFLCRYLRNKRQNDKVQILAEENEMGEYSKGNPMSLPNQSNVMTEENESKATLKSNMEKIDYDDTDNGNSKKTRFGKKF